MEFQLSYSKSWKMMLWKCCTQYASKFGKLSTWLEKVSFHSNPKESQWQRMFKFSSVQFSRSFVSDSLRPHGQQHARPPCPSPVPWVYSNSCPSSWWCHPNISSTVVPFTSCLQSFPASGSFPNELVLRIRWPKYWSFSFKISPSNGYSGLISFRISLQFKGLSRVFSNTTVQKHQVFSSQLLL